jgi:hypothetical protein
MLGKEFTFAFHDGASSYVKASRALHQKLDFKVNSILRIKYQTWDALADIETWFNLPKPFQSAFGGEAVCAPSFASRWRTVVTEQQERLEQLGRIRKPGDLLAFLDQKVGGAWSSQATEYSQIHGKLAELSRVLDDAKQARRELYNARRETGQKWQLVQREMGDHFRATIFEKTPTADDLAKREAFKVQLEAIRDERDAIDERYVELGAKEREAARSEAFVKIHKRRREIELESELKRLTLIREAVISSKGLENANRRPSAWWIPLVSPDGKWFERIMETATCCWEPMN